MQTAYWLTKAGWCSLFVCHHVAKCPTLLHAALLTLAFPSKSFKLLVSVYSEIFCDCCHKEEAAHSAVIQGQLYGIDNTCCASAAGQRTKTEIFFSINSMISFPMPPPHSRRADVYPLIFVKHGPSKLISDKLNYWQQHSGVMLFPLVVEWVFILKWKHSGKPQLVADYHLWGGRSCAYWEWSQLSAQTEPPLTFLLLKIGTEIHSV